MSDDYDNFEVAYFITVIVAVSLIAGKYIFLFMSLQF